MNIKSLSALGLLALSVQLAVANDRVNGQYDHYTCEELLDIRNFYGSGQEPLSRYMVSIKFGPQRIYLVTTPYRQHGHDLIQVRLENRFHVDPYFLTLVGQVVRQIFADRVVEGMPHTPKLIWLKKMAPQTLKERVERMVELLDSGFLTPFEAAALSIHSPHRSERIQAIREMLIRFLSNHGIQADETYYTRRLNRMHQDLLNSLSIFEGAVFHYSIFDRDLSWEARHLMEERIETFKKLGSEEAVDLDTYVKQIRERILNLVRRDFALYNETQSRVQEFRHSKNLQKIQNLLEKRQKLREKLHEVRQSWRREYEEKFLNKRPSDVDQWREYWHRLEVAYHEPTRKLQRELKLLNVDMEVLQRQLTIPEKKAYHVIEQSARNSNFNPMAFEVDHPLFWSKPIVVLLNNQYDSYVRQTDQLWPLFMSARVAPGAVSGDREFNRDGWGEALSEETAADSLASLEEVGMSAEVIANLNAVGIRNIYEITRYSARDFIEVHNFSPTMLDQLLDELNVLGIHLHFDGKWDRENLRIRKKRPEFYEQKHVPNTIVKWHSPSTPGSEIDESTR